MADKQEAVRISTPVGRLINNSLFEKDAFTDERGRDATPSYKVEMAFDPADLEDFEDAVVQAAIDFFGDGAEKDYEDGNILSPVRDGDDLAATREEKGKSGDAYKGMLVIRGHTLYNRNGEDAPGGVYVCGADATELDFADRGTIFNGSFGIANVTLAPYHGVAGGLPGVTLYLNGYQFVKDGDRLRGADPSSLFSPMMGKKSEGKGRKRRGK